MKYNTIKLNDIANGDGVCLSIYTQGCPHHCKGCFNPETWSYAEGKEFTVNTLKYIIDNLNTNDVERDLCILGGEPLDIKNLAGVYALCIAVKKKYPNKKIWLWTGYKFEDITFKEIFYYIDVLIDGEFIEELKDINLRYCGSSNQRVINVKETLMENKIVLWR